MYLVLTHIVGGIGGFFGKKKGIPAGAMIGALMAVALMNTAVGYTVHYPIWLRVIVQIVSGLVIGSRFTRNDLKELRTMGKAVLILLASLLTLNVVFAFLMMEFSKLSFMTALFAGAPGGMSDLALVAVDFGASTDQVMILQLFRFVVVVVFFPNLIKKLYLTPKDAPADLQEPADAPQQPAASQGITRTRAAKCLVSVGGAAAGALLLRGLNVPAGAIIGSIVATVILNLSANIITYPSCIKVISRVFAGCYIGSQISRETWFTIGGLLIPMAIMVLEVVVMSFGTAYLIHRFTGMNKATALFCSTPGGIVEMGLIAEELGLDTPKIVLMHTCRLITVICMMPVMAHLFS